MSSTLENSLDPPFSDLEPVKMSRKQRNLCEAKGWPVIWHCNNHPQWLQGEAETTFCKEAFVYICDTSLEGILESLKVGAQAGAPGLGDDRIKEYGESYVYQQIHNLLTDPGM